MSTLTIKDKELIAKAETIAKKFSDVGKFNFKGEQLSVCGAALRTKDGKVFVGPNIFHPDAGSTSVCAEITALVKAYSEGYTEIDIIVAYFHGEGKKKIWSPCGRCREFLRLFGNPWIIVNKDNKLEKIRLNELLPLAENWEQE